MVNSNFVGRESELQQLAAFLNRALAGRGQVAFVAGEAGSGKSALVRAFADQAQIQHSDLIVAMGNCNAQSGLGDPYLPFREVLAVLTGLSGGGVAQPADGRPANRLATLFARSIQVLVETGPDLIGTFVPGASLLGKIGKEVVDKAGWLDELEKMARRNQPSAAGSNVSVFEQNRIFEQYANVLAALASSYPLLLILDDLHWADEASISLLFHLSRRIEQSRILLLGTYRPDEVALPRRDAQGNEQRHPLEKVLAEIKRYVGDVWLDLGMDQAAEARTFTDHLIDTQPNRLGESFRTALFERTGGHALFTVELLRILQERGGLARDEQGRWVVTSVLNWDTVPVRVEGVLEERLGRLGDAQRELLGAASVEGVSFTVDVLAQVQQLPMRQVVRDLAQQLDKRHHLVREQNELHLGGRRLARYQFVHALFQQFLYQELSTAERRLLHGEVARALEQLCVGQTDDISAQLAWHYDQSDEDDKAIDYLIIAGERAIRAGAPNEARGHFQRALELLSQSEQGRRWRALLGRETALALLGDLTAQQADVSTLLALAEAANDDGWRAEAYQRQAAVIFRLHDQPLLIRAAEQAIVAARQGGQLALEARGLAIKASALDSVGQTYAAHQAYEEALARARESGDAASISFVANRATESFASSRELERAVQVGIVAVEMACSVGDRHLEATALGGLGLAYGQLGLYEVAKESLQSAMKLHEVLGNRFQYAYTVLFLGSVLLRRGEAVVAKAMLERVEGEVVASERFWHGGCSLVLALIAEQMGDWETAAQRAQEGRDLLSQIGTKGYAVQCEAILARSALAEGRLDEAESSIAQIWAYLQEYGAVYMGLPFLACLTCIDVFQVVGDRDNSQAVIEFSYRTLMEYADRISNVEWRKSFLEHFPEHSILIQRWHDLHAMRGVTER